MRILLAVMLAAFAVSSLAADLPDYEALRAARPDGRTLAAENVTLQRDAFRLQFRSGKFHFLAPVAGRTLGVVFIGDGSYDLEPATESERRQLALSSGDASLRSLSDAFDQMVILFTDESERELLMKGEVTKGLPDPKATSIYDDYRKDQKSRYSVNVHLRLLRDLLNGEKPLGVFVAAVDGRKHPKALMIHDPLGIGNFSSQYSFFGGEETAFIVFDNEDGGLWYLSAPKGIAREGWGRPLRPIADAIHYKIETAIAGNEQLDGTTTIQLQVLEDRVRLLPLHILPKLRIKSASIRMGEGAAREAQVIQEEVELGRLARLFRLEVADADAAVIFPEALPAKTSVEVTLHYSGRDVLHSVGDGYSVRARESWYPNVGVFVDLASYELTFRYPKKTQLVSVGERVSEREDGKERVAVWKSQKPLRVAGFNYGRFVTLSKRDADTGLQFDIYTQRDFSQFANDTFADAANAARVATHFFGKAPYAKISVTQQVEWGFGQSWPSLVFLPTVAMTSSTERVFDLEGMPPDAMANLNEFVKMVGWHEMAHQWWGHEVGWESYRDQWLSEGFAEFSAAMTLEVTEGSKKYNDFWERRRREIVQTARGSSASPNDIGAVSQGFRLSTRRSPGAAQAIVYGKGAYIVHMLRMMFRTASKPGPDQDERFAVMMRDFVTSHSGKNPSTADFQKVAERHMTPQMDLAQNGKLDWFFDQWVRGTEVPRIRIEASFAEQPNGRYRLSGHLIQEGVSASFRSLVPVYADFGDNQVARLGTMPLQGTVKQALNVEMPLPKKPRRALVNAMHDVLSRD